MARQTGERRDVVVLGSSPLLLIEALLLARSGRAVTVVDAGPGLGGAWRQMDAFEDLRDVEAACHVLENYRGFAQFLGDELGMPLHPLDPAPRLVDRNGTVHRYDSRMLVLRRFAHLALRLPLAIAVRAFEKCTGGRWRWQRLRSFGVRRACGELHRLLLHPIGREAERVHHYPDGGAPGMLRWFTEQLLAHGAEIRTGDVREIDVAAHRATRLHFADGSDLWAAEVVCTESIALEKLIADGVGYLPNTESVDYPHLVLEVSGTYASVGSYVHFPRDAELVRFSDITDYVQPRLRAGHRLLLVETRPGIDVQPSALIARLRRLGMLPDTAQVERCEGRTLTLSRSTPLLTELLPRHLQQRCRTLRSTGDLAAAVLRERPRWRRLLKAARTAPAHAAEPVVVLPQNAARSLSNANSSATRSANEPVQS